MTILLHRFTKIDIGFCIYLSFCFYSIYILFDLCLVIKITKGRLLLVGAK
jgi:hypothetical protein